MSEGLAQGPFVAASVGFELATLQIQGTELTTEPPRPTSHLGTVFYHRSLADQ